jgi:hypothetical protein
MEKEVFDKLYEIMRKRGFPKKPVSESDVVADAIKLLHLNEFKRKKKGGEE